MEVFPGEDAAGISDFDEYAAPVERVSEEPANGHVGERVQQRSEGRIGHGVKNRSIESLLQIDSGISGDAAKSRGQKF